MLSKNKRNKQALTEIEAEISKLSVQQKNVLQACERILKETLARFGPLGHLAFMKVGAEIQAQMQEMPAVVSNIVEINRSEK